MTLVITDTSNKYGLVLQVNNQGMHFPFSTTDTIGILTYYIWKTLFLDFGKNYLHGSIALLYQDNK